jgi:hypothetical protein
MAFTLPSSSVMCATPSAASYVIVSAMLASESVGLLESLLAAGRGPRAGSDLSMRRDLRVPAVEHHERHRRIPSRLRRAAAQREADERPSTVGPPIASIACTECC